MMTNSAAINLQKKLREFAAERDWDQFHSPKNLAMALMVEVAELGEHFQWLTEAESKKVTKSEDQRQAVAEELADVYLYLLRLADVLNIDLDTAANDKIKINARKYPVELAKGNARKYSQLKKEQ